AAALPAAEAEAALAAGHQKAPAEIPHVTLDRVLLVEADALGRHVGEDDEVVALELPRGRRNSTRAPHVDFEVAGRECPRQVTCAAFRALHVEHARPTGHDDRGGDAVVGAEAIVALGL